MFLHDGNQGNVSTYATDVIEQILYLLWDVGFRVGHSTRSIAEAVEQANKDMLTKTAMLESRSLAGDSHLAARLRTAFRQQCVRGRHM
jgi:[protein-PII] uridylyltransferase